MAKKPRNSASSNSNGQAHYDIEFVRSAASYQWPAILREIGGIDPDTLDGRHHPCPKCGGNDRFRLIDQEAGGCYCNQCFNRDNGDGFAALMWLTGLKFAEVLAKVADFLGVQPTKSSQSNGKSKKEAADPTEHLVFQPWNDALIAMWCYWKSPITPQSIQAVGGRIARYRGQYTVLALPVWGEDWQAENPIPTGWVLYNITGGTLPTYRNGGRASQSKVEWLKVKLTAGSQPGIICDREKLKSAACIWKVEGPSDLLSMLSLADLAPSHAALTNANGANEKPSPWMIDLFASRIARVIHDADLPGEQGAIGRDNGRGKFQPGWAGFIAGAATECKHVRLPYEIVPTHGKDLRDWTGEGGNYVTLLDLADATPVFEPSKAVAAIDPGNASSPTSAVNEADDDPHRLARINIERYAKLTGGGVIRYWREEWYTWTPGRGYRRIAEKALRARINEAVKADFDRLHARDRIDAPADKIPEVRKVTNGLIANIVSAMESLCMIPWHYEQNTWIDFDTPDAKPQKRNLISMNNGLIDLDAIFEEQPEEKTILPRSSYWFSTIHFDYDFDPNATCKHWEHILAQNLDYDAEKIAICQEWAGYILTPDTGFAKFLALEGEGRNGKGVYMAGLTAIVGEENCSSVELDQFGDKFQKGTMRGRLVNFCADVGEIDRPAEGAIKSLVSGDRTTFDRKFKDAVEAIPTARLTLAWNNSPSFKDKSSAIWRRMLLVKWHIQHLDTKKIVRGMDKPEYWKEIQPERPGMFIWALQGLIRIHQQSGFTESQETKEAIEDYRMQANPPREFLLDHVRTVENGSIPCSMLYRLYAHWSEKTGHKYPLADRAFGKEVRRAFPKVERKQVREGGNLHWSYQGINFSVDEVMGEKTYEWEFRK